MAALREVIRNPSVFLVRQPYHCSTNEVKQIFRSDPFPAVTGLWLVKSATGEFSYQCTMNRGFPRGTCIPPRASGIVLAVIPPYLETTRACLPLQDGRNTSAGSGPTV